LPQRPRAGAAGGDAVHLADLSSLKLSALGEADAALVGSAPRSSFSAMAPARCAARRMELVIA